MKRVEITYRSNMAELNKLAARLERAQKNLAKKKAIADDLGVGGWSNEDHYEWLRTVPTKDGFIVNKSDIEKNGAWFDVIRAESEVEDTEDRIEKAEKRFAKAAAEVTAYYSAAAMEEDLKRKEELYKLAFEEEQKEWAKDGIVLEHRYIGRTPKGKRFWIERNNGWTERSLHCYTLTLTNDKGMAYTVFTSGEFWRAYGVVKNS